MPARFQELRSKLRGKQRGQWHKLPFPSGAQFTLKNKVEFFNRLHRITQFQNLDFSYKKRPHYSCFFLLEIMHKIGRLSLLI
jgi:hypothetical protein